MIWDSARAWDIADHLIHTASRGLKTYSLFVSIMARNQEASFKRIYREFHRPVVNIFIKKGCSLEDAEDLASETFARAYRGFGEFRGHAKPLTWLHTIAANVWRNQVRDATAAKRDGIEIALPEERHEAEAFRIRPNDPTLSAERHQFLKSAVSKLPPRMRRCVQLRVYQELSFREIAEILGVTEATAKSQVSLARRRLRSLLAEHYPNLAEMLD